MLSARMFCAFLAVTAALADGETDDSDDADDDSDEQATSSTRRARDAAWGSSFHRAKGAWGGGHGRDAWGRGYHWTTSPAPRYSPNMNPYTKALNQQVDKKNAVEKCPCVIRPGSNTCMTYDFRLQAATLPEAIRNFPDLIINSEDGADPTNPWRATDSAYDSMKCRDGDTRCKYCTLAMIYHLHYGVDDISGEEMKGLIDYFDLDDLDETASKLTSDQVAYYFHRNCGGYEFFEQKARPGSSRSVSRNPTEQSPRGLAAMSILEREGPGHYQRLRGHHQHGHGRRRRQAGSAAPIVGRDQLGNEQKIYCVAQGDKESANNDKIAMCSLCWVWRVLPSDYFPTYVNELVCDRGNLSSTPGSNPNKVCLSGYGECNQRVRYVNVLKNTGTELNPDWRPQRIQVGTCCDCAVFEGSLLESFVKGQAAQGAPLPPPTG